MTLTADEKMALIAILKVLVESSELDDAELSVFEKLATSRGFHDYSHIFERVDREIKTEEDLNRLLEQVTSHESREKIMKMAVDLIKSDGLISGEENRLIGEIARSWKLTLKEIING